MGRVNGQVLEGSGKVDYLRSTLSFPKLLCEIRPDRGNLEENKWIRAENAENGHIGLFNNQEKTQSTSQFCVKICMQMSMKASSCKLPIGDRDVI